MRPRIFIFCSYLHKKLCDDVLGPSDPFLDPLRPSAGPNRGPKFVDIRENSIVQAVILRGTDRRHGPLEDVPDTLFHASLSSQLAKLRVRHFYR